MMSGRIISRKTVYRTVAFTMLLVMAFLLPANHLLTKEAYAAAQKKKYIKQLKVFSKKDGKEKDAQKWCDSQAENKDKDEDNDWYVIPGDLNEGAAGKMKSDVGVFLVYQATTDVKEAIRDIAVMNEQGNYSVGAYELLLDEQRDYYKDLVTDMKTMLEEYRANYNNKVPMAVNAHDFLDTYIDDDSGKRLGTLLLTISDEDLAELLLQANGQVVLVVQEQLASACDTKKTTWLDRMEALGGYAKLKSKYLKAYNGNADKATKALKTKYHEKALILADSWEDIKQHFDDMNDFFIKNGLDKMSDEDREAWMQTQADNLSGEEESASLNDYQIYIHNQEFLTILGAYTYEDSSLLDFFLQDKEAVTGENITKLYPLAECLSDGQIAGLNETVSLYSLLMAASTSTVIDGNNAPKTAEIEKLTGEDGEAVEEAKEQIEESIDEWKDTEPISIYEGVDRGLFEGSVAVTSVAETYNTGDGSTWADSFVESGALTGTAIGMGVGSILSAAGAFACSYALKSCANEIIKNSFNHLKKTAEKQGAMFMENFADEAMNLSRMTRQMVAYKDYEYFTSIEGLVKNSNMSPAQKAAEMSNLKQMNTELFEKGISNNVAGVGMAKFMYGLKIGLAVFAVLLAVADITMTIIALVKYYNRSHLAIPKYMVDMSYDEDKEKTFISYKGLLDTGGEKQGDLNGGGGKQWLAIYATTDEGAGDPILAPDGELHNMIVQKKDSAAPLGYSPLHLFGKPNAAQNLTFADGEAGWSFNDDEGGIYLFFERDADWNLGADASGAATVFSGGRSVLFGGCGLIIGLALGIIGTVLFKRKKKAAA